MPINSDSDHLDIAIPSHWRDEDWQRLIEQLQTQNRTIRQWPKVFDQPSVAMVEAGEAGGVLDEALKRLAKLLKDTTKLQNQIKGAMGYPFAVLVIAILVFLRMTILPCSFQHLQEFLKTSGRNFRPSPSYL